jgi:hypothetical protein
MIQDSGYMIQDTGFKNRVKRSPMNTRLHRVNYTETIKAS